VKNRLHARPGGRYKGQAKEVREGTSRWKGNARTGRQVPLCPLGRQGNSLASLLGCRRVSTAPEGGGASERWGEGTACSEVRREKTERTSGFLPDGMGVGGRAGQPTSLWSAGKRETSERYVWSGPTTTRAPAGPFAFLPACGAPRSPSIPPARASKDGRRGGGGGESWQLRRRRKCVRAPQVLRDLVGAGRSITRRWSATAACFWKRPDRDSGARGLGPGGGTCRRTGES
jgi:hypothetical protein